MRCANSSGWDTEPDGALSVSLPISTSAIGSLPPFMSAQGYAVLDHLAARAVQDVIHRDARTRLARHERRRQRGRLDVGAGHVEARGEQFEVDSVKQRLARRSGSG